MAVLRTLRQRRLQMLGESPRRLQAPLLDPPVGSRLERRCSAVPSEEAPQAWVPPCQMLSLASSELHGDIFGS